MKAIYRNTIKRIVVPLGLICMMLVPIISQSDGNFPQITQSTNEFDNREVPTSAATPYPSIIYGAGTSRETRILTTNTSSGTGLNGIQVDSYQDGDFLVGGQFNVTFDPTYDTNYTLEDDTPLYHPKRTYRANPTLYDRTLDVGSVDDLSRIVSDNGVSALFLSADVSGDHTVSIGVDPDFADAKFNGIQISNNESLMGVNIGLQIRSPTRAVELEILAYDYIAGEWDIVSTQIINQNSNEVTYNAYFINENSRYIPNDDGITVRRPQIQFNFVSTGGSYQLSIDYIVVNGLQAQEIEISQTKHVALEFDLKGDSVVYGFYTWIRSLGLAETIDMGNLVIDLYEKNTDYGEKRSDLLLDDGTLNIVPGVAKGSLLTSQRILTNFTQDKPVWIALTANSSGVALNYSNYFIDISAEALSGDRKYSLVVLPYTHNLDPTRSDPDSKIDHIVTTNATGTWAWVKSNFNVTIDGFTANIVSDAALFAINLTRPYLPSEIQAEVDGVVIQNTYIQDYPHDEGAGKFWWGYGTVEVIFNEPIISNAGIFDVPFSWNTSIYSENIGMAANYNVTKYSVSNSPSYYALEPDMNVYWNSSYTHDTGLAEYLLWEYHGLQFVLPSDWTMDELTLPTGPDVQSYLTLSEYNETYSLYTLSKNDFTARNGTYQIKAYSPNYLQFIETFMDYNDNSYSTYGFEIGDNITARVGGLAVDKYLSNGITTLTIYNATSELQSINNATIHDNSSYSWYDFGRIFSQVNQEGEYILLANWTNGEEAGIFKQPIWVGNYDASIANVEYRADLLLNQMTGLVDPIPTTSGTYSIYTYAIEEWESIIPEEPVINRTSTIHLGQGVYLTSYIQNETVLNSLEDVQLTIHLENRNTTLAKEVQITAQIIAYQENNWIMTENSVSDILNIYGDASDLDESDFEIILSVPSTAMGGLTGPIRNLPYQIKLTYEIEGEVFFF